MQGWLRLVCQPVFYHLFVAFTAWKTEEYKSFAQNIPAEKQNEAKKNRGETDNFGCSFTIQFLLTQQLTAIQIEILYLLRHNHFFLLATHSQHVFSVASRSQQIRKSTYTPNQHTGSVFKKSKKSPEQAQEVGLHCWVEGKGPEEERISLLSRSQTLCTLTGS